MLFSRRKFVANAGLVGLTPFLASLWPAGRKRPRRFIAIFTPNAHLSTHWYPPEATPLRTVAPAIRETDLAAFPESISPVFGSAFDSLRSKLLLLRGLDIIPISNQNHWPARMLCSVNDKVKKCITADQRIAAAAQVYADKNPLKRSLHLAVAGPSQMDNLAYNLSYTRSGGETLPIVPEMNPRSAFHMLFSASDSAPRKLVIDRLQTAYGDLLTSSRLSTSDKAKLSSHLDFLRDLEAGVSPRSPTCVEPPIPPRVGPEVDYRLLTRQHLDMVLAAVKCDLSRVAVVQLGAAADARIFSFIPEIANDTSDGSRQFHGMTHDGPSAFNKMLAIDRWQASEIAEFLKKLDEVEDTETGETYLDNSLVYWGSELGTWGTEALANINQHQCDDMPVLVAGGCQGFIKTGRFVDYRQIGVRKREPNCPDGHGPDFAWIGRPMNEFLISVMQAMGLTSSDWEEGDEPGFGDYSENYAGQYVIGDRRSGLPAFTGT